MYAGPREPSITSKIPWNRRLHLPLAKIGSSASYVHFVHPSTSFFRLQPTSTSLLGSPVSLGMLVSSPSFVSVPSTRFLLPSLPFSSLRFVPRHDRESPRLVLNSNPPSPVVCTNQSRYHLVFRLEREIQARAISGILSFRGRLDIFSEEEQFLSSSRIKSLVQLKTWITSKQHTICAHLNELYSIYYTRRVR